MMKRMSGLSLVGAVCIALFATAWHVAAAASKCGPGNTDADLINACTAIIDSGALDKRQLAGAHAFRAGALSRQRKFDKAIADYDEAVRLQPKWPPTYVLRGLTYAEMGKHDNAVRDYDKAIALFPNDFAAYFRRGISHAKLGNQQQAIIDYSRAIELDPDDAGPYRKRGVLQFARGKLDLAIADFGKALALEPNDVESLNNRCFVQAVADKQLVDALEDCERALKLKPQSAIRDSRGFVYLRLGKFKEAIDDFSAAFADNPKAADALYKRGLAKLRLGDVAGGNADLAAATALDSGVAEEIARYGLKP